MKKRILALVVGLWVGLGLVSCGKSATQSGPSGLTSRVLASQGVSTTSVFGSLVWVDARTDTIARVAPLNAGNSPGLMTLSPTHNIVAAFDSTSNTVFAFDTIKETSIGSVRLAAPTTSILVPSAQPSGYAAEPSATINGFSFIGAVQVLNFAGSGLTTTIAVPGAQTVVASDSGSQLLVFSNDSDSVTVLSPALAVPPVDTSCLTNPPNSVCTIVTSNNFSRPVSAIVSGSTAYILNCGTQCGGSAYNTGANALACGPAGTAVTQACVVVFDLGSLSVTNTIPVDGATMAYLSGSTLYVAGTPPINNACTGQTTAATTCGRLDLIDLSSETVTSTAVITDGFHQRMDLTTNGQLFIGSRGCTNIGNVNDPSGEVRGCLSIYKLADGSVFIPPDNGDVNGLQGLISRNIEYVAEGGALRVYDTRKDILLINQFVPQGSVGIVGYVGDVKAIDAF